MKKAIRLLVTLLLALALVFSFAACGTTPGGDDGGNGGDNNQNQPQTVELSALLSGVGKALVETDELTLTLSSSVKGEATNAGQKDSIDQSVSQTSAFALRPDGGMNTMSKGTSKTGTQAYYTESYDIDGLRYSRQNEEDAFSVSSSASTNVPFDKIAEILSALDGTLSLVEGTVTAAEDGTYTYTGTLDFKEQYENLMDFLDNEAKTLTVGNMLAPIVLDDGEATAADLGEWIGETFSATITVEEFVGRVDVILGVFGLNVQTLANLVASLAGIAPQQLQQVFEAMFPDETVPAPAAADTVYSYALTVLGEKTAAPLADTLLAEVGGSPDPGDQPGGTEPTDPDVTAPGTGADEGSGSEQELTFAGIGQMLQSYVGDEQLTIAALFDQFVPMLGQMMEFPFELTTAFLQEKVTIAEASVTVTLKADSDLRLTSFSADVALDAQLMLPAGTVAAAESEVDLDIEATASGTVAYTANIALPEDAVVDGVAFAEITLAAGGSIEIPYGGDVAGLVENNNGTFTIVSTRVRGTRDNFFSGVTTSTSTTAQLSFTVGWKDDKVVFTDIASGNVLAADDVIEAAQEIFDDWAASHDPAADMTWTIEFEVYFTYEEGADSSYGQTFSVIVPVTLSAQA